METIVKVFTSYLQFFYCSQGSAQAMDNNSNKVESGAKLEEDWKCHKIHPNLSRSSLPDHWSLISLETFGRQESNNRNQNLSITFSLTLFLIALQTLKAMSKSTPEVVSSKLIEWSWPPSVPSSKMSLIKPILSWWVLVTENYDWFINVDCRPKRLEYHCQTSPIRI